MAKKRKLSESAKKIRKTYEVDAPGYKKAYKTPSKENAFKRAAGALRGKSKSVMITLKRYKTKTVKGKRVKIFLKGL